VLRAVDSEPARILIVGHNPGLSELVTTLTGDPVDLATATLAQVVLPIERWSDVHVTTPGTLAAIWRPRE
jgi:phosphohistidine phosphatase